MPDRFDSTVRSEIMRRVKSKDTKIEKRLRQALWARGLRYRKNYKGAIGKPDLVFVSRKIAVFCDSEFWHGYDWDNRKHDIKSNQDFWYPKIERNIQRDIDVKEKLESEGWVVLRFWGADIENRLEECVAAICSAVGERS